MAAETGQTEFAYPRRRVIRAVLKRMAIMAMEVMTDLEVIGRENLPEKGPLLLVANHFSPVDPVAMIRAAPWPPEFVGGFQMPNAPVLLTWIPTMWGYYPVHRGTASRYALKAAQGVLAQDGILGIFPEAGSWATVLRPARPGAAFLAAETGAPILPMGFGGMEAVLPGLGKGRRVKTTIRIGKVFGPFQATGRGRARRRQIDEFGHEIMRRIAELIPPERRGHYSDDPAIREAAQGTEVFPWADAPEGSEQWKRRFARR